MDKKIKIKLNAPLLNHKKGDLVEVLCDSDGIPYNAYWRRRFVDAQYDHCVETVSEPAKPTETLDKKDK